MEDNLVLKNISFLRTILALALILFPTLVFAANGSVRVSVSFDKNSFGYDEGVIANVTFTNNSKREVQLLRWLTPIDGVKDDLFAVEVNGKSVEYIGADYKRPAPTAKDYLTLGGGETISFNVDLEGYYDLSQTGYYKVGYNVESANIFSYEPSLLSVEDSLNSPASDVWIVGREIKMPEETVADAVTGPTSFTSCSSSRQSSLITARNNASTYSTNSYNYLNAGTTSSRYTTWFGTYNSSRYSTVRSHFSSIRNAMDTASVRFNCSCTDSAYAYVYPTQPYTIYLCNAFWSAPSTGTDSKAGTLVHEMSHFNVVAGTDDWAYGQTAAKNLARSNPSRAVDNADSHEYFAENTPSLP